MSEQLNGLIGELRSGVENKIWPKQKMDKACLDYIYPQVSSREFLNVLLQNFFYEVLETIEVQDRLSDMFNDLWQKEIEAKPNPIKIGKITQSTVEKMKLFVPAEQAHTFYLGELVFLNDDEFYKISVQMSDDLVTSIHQIILDKKGNKPIFIQVPEDYNAYEYIEENSDLSDNNNLIKHLAENRIFDLEDMVYFLS